MFNPKVVAAICAIVALAAAPAAYAQSTGQASFNPLTFSFGITPGTFGAGEISGEVEANGINFSDTTDGTTLFNWAATDPGPGPASATINYSPPLTSFTATGSANAFPGGFSFAALDFFGFVPFTTTNAATLTITGTYSMLAQASMSGFAEMFLGYAVFFDVGIIAQFENSVCACFGLTAAAGGPINDPVSIPFAGDGAILFGFSGQADDVGVAAIPEPSTYALMLAGLGLVGFVAHRRRRAG